MINVTGTSPAAKKLSDDELVKGYFQWCKGSDSTTNFGWLIDMNEPRKSGLMMLVQ